MNLGVAGLREKGRLTIQSKTDGINNVLFKSLYFFAGYLDLRSDFVPLLILESFSKFYDDYSSYHIGFL